ncbi:MAG TPA: phosphatase PAP2 family protein [Pirellulales bacterium]|nr:phosphatase PAP2 family protein [Pirellulales bacterium]
MLAIVATVLVVAACYAWIDRPVAFYVHDQGIEKIPAFKWLTYPPPLLQTWSPAILVLAALRRSRGPLAHWQFVLVVSCLSLIVADGFRASLGDLCGRYWPETWFNDNPSLIGTGTYGFHPFQAGDDIGSFPSGHAARILGFISVWWIAMPASRILLAVASLPMLVSLVAMDYHFVSDVIAGAVLGAIVGTYAAAIANLHPPAANLEGALSPAATFNRR